MRKPTVAQWQKAFKVVNSKPEKVVKVEWLSRAPLFVSNFCLCLTEKEYLTVIKKLNIKNPSDYVINEHSDATVHHFSNADGPCFVVCLRLREKYSTAVIHAMLVHEAVHIWQEWVEFLGETKPGQEFEAYTIQHISKELIASYIERTKRK